MNPNDLLSIGDLARRTGLSTSAIRFYEDKGLIQSHRTAGNQRRFLRSDIRRLSFILIVQRLGLSLEEIGDHLRSLPKGRTPSSFDWWKISEAIRESLDRRIAQLQSLRDNLDGCIGCGCLSLKTCKLYNPDDVAAEGGAGPRVLR
jgi:MerR family redox-sensitive transcriptional activator SoxR